MLVPQCQLKAVTLSKEIRHFQADRLRKFRELLGKTQAELDKICGFSIGSIQRYEGGESQPGADALFKIATTLEISIDFLLGLTENPEISGSPRRLTQGEQALLALYRNDLRWEMVMRLAQEATEREKLKNVPTETDE